MKLQLNVKYEELQNTCQYSLAEFATAQVREMEYFAHRSVAKIVVNDDSETFFDTSNSF